MKPGYLLIILAMTFMLISCNSSFDDEIARGEIIELHQNFIKSHLSKDLYALTAAISNNYLFISNGNSTMTKANDLREMLEHYLYIRKFSRYEDTTKSIIGFSKDQTIAGSIVPVSSAGVPLIKSEKDHYFDIQLAWITLYKKRQDKGLRIADVSTNKSFLPSDKF